MTDPTASAGAPAMPVLKSSQAAIDLIVMEEVSSQAAYTKLYQGPTWPGGASGVTIGIGYDCGYSTAATIQADWSDKLPAPTVKALEEVAGIHGSPASSYAHALHGVVTVPWEAAMAVFQQRDMPKWEAIVTKALPNTDKLTPDSFGALVSLAYNRGPSFQAQGDRFTEMREIHAAMVSGQPGSIPGYFRGMERLWPNVAGLRNRREAEARLFEKGLRSNAA